MMVVDDQFVLSVTRRSVGVSIVLERGTVHLWERRPGTVLYQEGA